MHRPGLLRGRRRCARRRRRARSGTRALLRPVGARRVGSSTCPATVRPDSPRPACVASRSGRRHGRRRGAVLLAPPAHPWRRRSDRAPDFHHLARSAIAIVRFRLSLLLLLLLASCGDLPEPFLGNPGAAGRQLAQPPTPRLAVPPPTNALLPDAASRQFADALAGRAAGRTRCRRSPSGCTAATGAWSPTRGTADGHRGAGVHRASTRRARTRARPRALRCRRGLGRCGAGRNARSRPRPTPRRRSPSLLTGIQTANCTRPEQPVQPRRQG